MLKPFEITFGLITHWLKRTAPINTFDNYVWPAHGLLVASSPGGQCYSPANIVLPNVERIIPLNRLGFQLTEPSKLGALMFAFDTTDRLDRR